MNVPASILTDAELDALVWETYALHYLWNNLGFDSENIFVQCAFVANHSPPGVHACAILRAQGREFVYTLRRIHPSDESRFGRAWLRFAAAQPQAPRSVLDLGVAQSSVLGSFHSITTALVEKGFAIPEELRRKFAKPIPGTVDSSFSIGSMDPSARPS